MAYIPRRVIKEQTDIQEAILVESLRGGQGRGLTAEEVIGQANRFLKAGIILQPKQWEMAACALECDRDKGPTAVGVGGARGGAKSHWMFAQIAASDCQRFTGLKVLLLRKTVKAMREQIRDMVIKVLPNIKHNYREQAGVIEFENGSSIIIGHFKDEKEIENYLGQEYDVIAIEELTTLTFEKCKNLMTCLRTSKVGWRPRMYAAWNWGGVGHCVPHGEALTPEGWRPIQNLKVGDPVMTLNEGSNLIVSKVSQTHCQMFSGNLKRVRQRGFSLVCTADHRLARMTDLLHNADSHTFVLTPFKDLPGHVKILRTANWIGNEVGPFSPKRVPSRKLRVVQPDTISGDSWMELLGWFLSEGNSTHNRFGKRFDISQIKPRGREKIRALLEKCGFKFNENETGFSVSSPSWSHYFYQFGKCREKFIPQEAKSANKRQLRLLFNAMMNGDGHWSGAEGGNGEYYTISDRLADDFQEIAFKLGYITSMFRRQRPNRFGKEIRISFKKTNGGCSEILTGNHRYKVATKTKRHPCVFDEPYHGPVYCIGVPHTHNFVIRQNGSVWISGNSFVKRLFYDPWKEHREVETRYVKALVTDNKFLNEDYRKTLESLTGWKRKSWLDGDPEFTAGQFFSCWDEQVHVFPNKKMVFIPQKSAIKWWGAYDFGFVHPGCFHLFCADSLGNFYTVDEVHQPRVVIEEWAEDIKACVRRHGLEVKDLDFIAAGKDCFSRNENGRTIAMQFQESGIEMTPVEIDRVNAWAVMQQALGDPANGIKPSWYIHQKCVNLITQIPLAQAHETRTGDVQKSNADPESGEGGDDAIEGARNGLVAMPTMAMKWAMPVMPCKYKAIGVG